jgi:acylphosphatase
MSVAVTRQIRVSGRVQGVGFRASLRHEARKARIAGWVRNRTDGTVEALLHGAPGAVEALIAWARRGPPGACVTALVAVDGDPHDAPAGSFELRPSA